jgi:Xaa-Pro aminopeptidase
MAGTERIAYPISRGELERRWRAARASMAEAGLDALVMQGSANFIGLGGYYRWFTGTSTAGGHAFTLIFPRDALMTVVCHGAFGGDLKLDGTDPEFPGVGRRLTTAVFPSIAYTAGLDGEIVADAIEQAGYRRIGMLGQTSMYHALASRIKTRLPGVTFTDASDLIDPLRAGKSAEEIDFIRRTAAMQDAVLAKTRDFLRPGLHDYEVTAYSQYVSNLLGSETGYFLAGSAPPGEPALYRFRPMQGRQMRDGDFFFWQAEISGPGGYFVHIGRIFVLGKAPQQIVDAFGEMVEAQDYTVRMLKPGASCPEIFAAYQAYMRSRNLPEEKRLHCHGQGYETVERPLIRHDETMPIRANMNIGCHPGYVNRSLFMTVCDNFLVGPDGAERLHKTPQALIEL